MRLTLTALAFMLSALLSAQAPALIPYQTVVRDAAGQPLASSMINAMFTIHHGSATGIEVWQELQTVSTNAQGLFTVQLGSSVPLVNVNWSVGTKFLQVELDLGNGFIDMGTQQMVSVPYALHAGSVRLDVSAEGDTLFIGNNSFVIVPGVSEANQLTSGSTFHSCGIANIHNPLIQYGSMVDQDGNEYKTVVIGEQEWMAENLKASSYRNGDEIQTNLTDSLWNSTTQGAWCYYDDNENNECPFGKLYNWYAAVDSRGICPVGWHVPSDEDWSALVDSLGNFSTVGVKLKTTGTLEDGTGLWRSPNQNANNSTGFSGLPGGFRNSINNWGAKDGYGYYWSASLNEEGNPLYRYLSFNNFLVYRYYSAVNTGFSVRCVRD
jgi:uncharacterized protein (TIGR02145 family)